MSGKDERAKCLWDMFLSHGRAFDWFAVSVEDLNFVHAAFVAAAVGPDDFLCWRYFQHLTSFSPAAP